MAASMAGAWWQAARPSRSRGRRRATPPRRSAKCWVTEQRLRPLLFFCLRSLRRTHAHDFEQAIAGFRLGAVPVNLAGPIHDIAAGGHRIGLIGVVMWPCPDPPRPGDHPD